MVTDNQMWRAERLIKDIPVRKFNYKTPNQVQLEKMNLLLELT
jgi:hypothetical protein